MKTFTFKHKLGFTMLELVMVIVVLGILAALALPRMERDHKQEAADHILSQIRYTQHLALNDDKHMNNNQNWQQRYWKISFTSCNDTSGIAYRIGSDDNMGSNGFFAQDEAAIDPINGKPIYVTNATCGNSDTNPNVLLGKKYGVTSINVLQCHQYSHIGFDHLGRPHQHFGNSGSPDYTSYMKAICTLTFTMSNNDTFQISIQPETGYAQIVGQDDS